MSSILQPVQNPEKMEALPQKKASDEKLEA